KATENHPNHHDTDSSPTRRVPRTDQTRHHAVTCCVVRGDRHRAGRSTSRGAMNASADAPVRPDQLIVVRMLGAVLLALALLASGTAIAPVSADAAAAAFGPDVSRWQHPNGKAI